MESNPENVAERYKHRLYSWNPEHEVLRWWVGSDKRIMVGGSILDADDFGHLRGEFGITHVVNVETEHSDAGKVPAELLCEARFEDDGAPIPAAAIDAIAAFCSEHAEGNSTSIARWADREARQSPTGSSECAGSAGRRRWPRSTRGFSTVLTRVGSPAMEARLRELEAQQATDAARLREIESAAAPAPPPVDELVRRVQAVDELLRERGRDPRAAEALRALFGGKVLLKETPEGMVAVGRLLVDVSCAGAILPPYHEVWADIRISLAA